MFSQDQIKELKDRVSKLKKALDIKLEMEELNKKHLISQESDFWKNQKNAEKLMKEIKFSESKINSFNDCGNSVEDLEVLFSFFIKNEIEEKEIVDSFKKAESLISNLEFKTMLNDPQDKSTAILTINPGAGGTESQDWAEMLMRMYIMWAEKNKYKVKEINYQSGDVAGIKLMMGILKGIKYI